MRGFSIAGRDGADAERALLAEAAYPSPAISLAGPYLGYAGKASDGLQNVDNVVVVDVRRRDELLFTAEYVGGVGSLKVNGRGSVAWIVCPFVRSILESWTARQVVENAPTVPRGASIAPTAAAHSRSRCSLSRAAPHSSARYAASATASTGCKAIRSGHASLR